LFCPRLDHFVRLNANGTIGKCGHMKNGRGYESFDELNGSEWLNKIRSKMQSDEWPDECARCRVTEQHNGESIRTKSIERHKILHPKKKDYLVVGGVLDNVCNSACQTCNSNLSTKIGSLESKYYTRVDNYVRFWELPSHRILEVDVNGGEPTASRNYKRILSNLPTNTKIVRMNTNASRMIGEIETLIRKGIMVIVTISLDGVGKVHDYVRWPIKWEAYSKTVDKYIEMRVKNKLLKLDFWTTVSSLNINDLENIQNYAKEKGISHSYSFLTSPDVYSVRYKNYFTMNATQVAPDLVAIGDDNSEQLNSFMMKQDRLRGISFKDYFNLDPNFSKNSSANLL